MEGVRKLENRIIPTAGNGISVPLALAGQNNLFLIDWLTFVAHGETVEYLKWLLGIGQSPKSPGRRSRNSETVTLMQTYWNGITISYGADDERFYKDPKKVRLDGNLRKPFRHRLRVYETYGKGGLEPPIPVPLPGYWISLPGSIVNSKAITSLAWISPTMTTLASGYAPAGAGYTGASLRVPCKIRRVHLETGKRKTFQGMTIPDRL